jgi:hypothetical protein
MKAGPHRRVTPEKLYAYAQSFYWDFRALAEGTVRFAVDREITNQRVKEVDRTPIPLFQADKERFNRMVDEEIRAGQLEEAGREQRYLQLKLDYLAKTRAWMRSQAQESAEKEINVPGEPDTLKELLDAETAEQVRRICEDAYTHRTDKAIPKIVTGRRVLNWPLHPASQLPSHLSDLAEQFVKAKNDSRFPRSNRPSSLFKQLWFLSRALAGALFGESTRTSINLVGSMRPEEMFEESGAAKPKRTRKKTKRRS